MSGSRSFLTEKATVGGIKMRQPTSRKQSSGKIVSEAIASAVPDIRPAEFCTVCRLVFGSHEGRVFVGDEVAHPRCVGRLRKSEAA